MVEMPAETAAEKTLSAEDKPQRQIAAVRGITPGQPAPMAVEEKTKQTWFGKVKAWLQGLGGTQPEEEIKPKARPARTDRPRREPRGEGREAKRDRDAERGEPRRTERGEGRSGQKPRAPGQPQAKRGREVVAPQAAAPATAEKTGETEAQEPRSRRGRRGGRRERGERVERPEAARNLPEGTEAPSEKALETAAPEMTSTMVEKAEAAPEKVSVVSLPVVIEEPAAVSVASPEPSKPLEIAPAATPTDVAPAVASIDVTPATIPADISTVTAQAESKPRAPRRRTPQAMPDDQIASSGLIMVETSPDKIKAVVEDAAASAPERPRPRRAPRPKIVEESAPLVQVETQLK
jgi:ribonuclease E